MLNVFYSIIMKKLFFILFTFICSYIYAQDVIYLRNNDSIVANVTKIDENTIEYKFEGEEIIVVKNKKSIHKIKFKSGREEVFNESVRLPKINGEEDWEKVIVTYDENEVEGLEKIDNIQAKSGWGGSIGSNIGYKKCVNKLKKDAAKLGGNTILIHGNPNSTATALGGATVVICSVYK